MKPSKKTKLLNKYNRAVKYLEALQEELRDQRFPDTCRTVRMVNDARFILLRFEIELEADIPARDKNATFSLEK